MLKQPLYRLKKIKELERVAKRLTLQEDEAVHYCTEVVIYIVKVIIYIVKLMKSSAIKMS